MKKLLFTLAILCSTIGFGQVQSHTATVVTHYLTLEDMMWSEIKGENIFLPKVARHRRSANWSFTLREDGSGLIVMEDLQDGDDYYLEVYDWKGEDFKGNDGIVAEFVQRFDGQKGTLMIQWRDGEYGISVFLPQEQSYMFFDNMNR
jgi:hypothetical protein